MTFLEDQGLRAYQFELFEDTHITHAIFTRRGGISPSPWSSLNLGGTVGDERAHVVENRRRIFEFAHRPVASIYDVWQVHGTRVLSSRVPRPLDSPHEQADGILTDHPEVTLFMRFADCVPILLYDPFRKIVGLVHAGWKGTLAGIAAVTIQRMVLEYGSQPADILAGIGPSICKDEYEVGDEVVQLTQETFQGDIGKVLSQQAGRYYFDLWAANQLILEKCGVKTGHIQIAGLCTARNLQDWYSHRAEHGKTGRFGAYIALQGS